jgi:hypothetical protein
MRPPQAKNIPMIESGRKPPFCSCGRVAGGGLPPGSCAKPAASYLRHIWPRSTLEASASEAARSRFGAGVKGKSNLYGLRKNLIRTEAIQLTPRETTEVSKGWRRRRAPRQG